MDEITFRESRKAAKRIGAESPSELRFVGDELIATTGRNSHVAPVNRHNEHREWGWQQPSSFTPPSQLQDLLVGLAGVGAMLCICWLLIAMLFHDTCNGRGC